MHDLSALLATPPAAPERVRTGALEPPQRSVGGAPVPEMLAVWVREGLPTYCPQCKATFKFAWDRVGYWVCPGRETGRCFCYVAYESLVSSADGDTVTNAYLRREAH